MVDDHYYMRPPWAPSARGPPLFGWAGPGANEPVVPLGPMSRWMSSVLSMRVYVYYICGILYIHIYIYMSFFISTFAYIYIYICIYCFSYIQLYIIYVYIHTHRCFMSLSLCLYIYIYIYIYMHTQSGFLRHC